MALSGKRAAFVREYLIDLNATQAAIRAGYSAKTARFMGAENLTKPNIAAAIQEAQAARSTRTEIDAEWVLRRLVDEAEADLADLYDDDGALKPVKEWPLVWRKGLVAGIEAEELREQGVTVGTVRKVKLSERIRRIELIGKHVGMFRDRVEHSGPGGGPIEHAVSAKDLSDDELARIVLGGRS